MRRGPALPRYRTAVGICPLDSLLLFLPQDLKYISQIRICSPLGLFRNSKRRLPAPTKVNFLGCPFESRLAQILTQILLNLPANFGDNQSCYFHGMW